MPLDETAERLTEAQRLKQAELIDQSSDALLIWEIEGGITFWNRGAEQLYGFARVATDHPPDEPARV